MKLVALGAALLTALALAAIVIAQGPGARPATAQSRCATPGDQSPGAAKYCAKLILLGSLSSLLEDVYGDPRSHTRIGHCLPGRHAGAYVCRAHVWGTSRCRLPLRVQVQPSGRAWAFAKRMRCSS